MCDFSGKLIAWLDRELPAEQASEIERHVEACSECRSKVDGYKRVSSEFDAYCDEAIVSNARRAVLRWVPAVAAAGALAALAALFLALPRTRIEPHAFHPPQVAVTAPPAVVAKGLPANIRPMQRVRRRHAVAPAQAQNDNATFAQNQNSYVLPDEPVIQIAISADEMFPPGAVPEGMHFVADLTIAADGSAERLRLRPRLAGFERSTTQP
ncbi:MAG TPA: zf-HC2 domain-containing protein [Verrucomicrobiae bacterium]|nr:zf-HC2 domain-containing protein [Verrucomicrobiae bacterium]